VSTINELVEKTKKVGKGERRVLSKVRLSFISGVDRPAQEGARVMIMKRADDGPAEKKATVFVTKEGDVEKRAALTSSVDGHSHLLYLDHGQGEQTSGTTSYGGDETGRSHSHPWVMDEGGTITIGEANGHTHAVGMISKQETETEEEGMPAEKKGNEATPSVEDRIAKLEKRAERAETVAELDDVTKAYFDGLEEKEQDAFLAKDADARKAEVEKAAEDSEEGTPVYKSADGTVFTSKDDPRMVAMAKRLDAKDAKITKLEVDAELTALNKRAEEELGNLPGEVSTRAQVLKQLEQIEDPEVRKRAIASVKAGDAALAKGFDRFGTAGTVEPGSPEDELEKLAVQYQKDHEGTSIEKARREVLVTEKGQELFNKLEKSARRAAVDG